MKKIKKRGFTLIELIVVLVILAIIALIVTPIVLNIVEKAEDSARKRSIDAYGHAIDLAVASYELDYGNYPNSLDNLKIDYSGDEVKCNVKIIRKSGDVYLSECSTQGVKVKDKKTEDGYYHYGKDDKEYIDLYGKTLEKQINDYIKKNGNVPTDLSRFDNKYSGDVSCEIKIINDDNTLYLSKCQVDDMLVRDESREDGYYRYGTTTAVNSLLLKANAASVTTYTDGNTHEMYTFTHDATVQTEALTDYRYIGTDPYNYVTFNNQLWRIIGVFTVEDANGNKEQRIKIIKDDINPSQKWDSNGVNEWSTASLQIWLNTSYYNSLSDDAKAMIGDTKYYLGGGSWNSTTHYGTAIDIYGWERGTTVYSGRSTNWIGKIGLMYPSDYAYTYANGVDNKCYTDTCSCNTSTPSSGWLYHKYFNQWVISPYSGYSNISFDVRSNGCVSDTGVSGGSRVRPSAYLISSIQLDKGTGTKDDPYTLKQA